MITFLFDSGYTWAICVPLALALVKVLHAPILWIFGAMQFIDIVKCVIGYILIRKGVWIQNIAKAHA